LKEKNIPIFLWPYILQAIAHIKNRTFNSAINTTPYKAVTKEEPDISYFKVLGSLVYTNIPKETRRKELAPRANKGILVGFNSSNNYLAYIPSLNKVISVRDIIIKEELNYEDDFNTEEDYESLLKDFNNEMNIEEPTSKETSIETPTSNTSSNTRIEVAIPPLQINPDDYVPYYSPSKEEKPDLANISIANLASKAYMNSLIEGENSSNSFNIDNKITITKPDNLIKEPKDYDQAINSYLYKEY